MGKNMSMRTRVENERSQPRPAAGPKLKAATSGLGSVSVNALTPTTTASPDSTAARCRECDATSSDLR